MKARQLCNTQTVSYFFFQNLFQFQKAMWKRTRTIEFNGTILVSTKPSFSSLCTERWRVQQTFRNPKRATAKNYTTSIAAVSFYLILRLDVSRIMAENLNLIGGVYCSSDRLQFSINCTKKIC